jgi:AcrR family transcriptional regulator
METTHRLTREELYELAWSKPLTRLAEELGITGNALAKICDRVLVPHPRRGYWSAAGGSRHEVRPPLPPAPDDCEDYVLISARRAGSRRGQSRLSLEARREQIAAAAAEIVLQGGVGAVTMKAVARRAGVSEALAYRYFSTVLNLLAFMARREQALMAQMQDAQTHGLTVYADRARASNAGVFDYVAELRGLLQRLLMSGELRQLLNAEYRSRVAWSSQVQAQNLNRQFGVPHEVGGPGWQMLRGAATRAGKLLANDKLTRDDTGRLANAIMGGARERLFTWTETDLVRARADGTVPPARPASYPGPRLVRPSAPPSR